MTGIVFAAAFFLSLILALVRHPRYGMFAYMAAFYVYPPARWWGASLPDFRWSLLASVVLFVAVYRRPRNPDQPPWTSTVPAKLLIAFTALVWIGNLWALDSVENLDFSILYTKYVVLYYFLYRLCDTEENIRDTLLAHVIGCFYLGYLAYGMPTEGDRLDGVGGPGINDSNTLGMQLATAVSCGAMFVLVERNWRLLVSLVSLAFILNGIVLCGSRGAFLAAVAGGLTLFFTKPKEHRRLFYVLAALGIVLFTTVASTQFWKRIDTLSTAGDALADTEDQSKIDNSAESRIYIVRGQMQMIATHPWGAGHRGTASLSRQYIPERYLERLPNGQYGERASHNSFMSALVEQGLPGALIFIWLILWSRKAARETLRILRDVSPRQVSYVAAVYGALVVVLIAGLFADFLAVEVTVWMFAILASMHGIAKNNPHGLSAQPVAAAPSTVNVVDRAATAQN